MRTFWGRVKHSLLFELVLLMVCTPIIALILNKSLSHSGMMSLGLGIVAMLCNGLYNYFFDVVLIFLKHPLYPRSFRLRCLHSILFEICLMIVTIPMIMWWMGLTFFQALVFDLSFLIFVPVYALVFNWVYDFVFPAPHVRNDILPENS